MSYMNYYNNEYIGLTGLNIFDYIDDTSNSLALNINNTSNWIKETSQNVENLSNIIGITDFNYISNWHSLTNAYGSNLIEISSNIGFININDKNNRCIYRYGDIKDGIEGLTDSDKLATILGVNYLGIPNVDILVEQLLTIYGWGNDIIDDDFEFVMVNNTYPFPYKWLKDISESPLLNNMNINIFDNRINSSNITNNVEELIKIVAEHEIRLSVSDFRSTLSPIDTAKIIAKWIYNTGKIATGLAPLTSQIYIKLLTHLDLIGGYTGYFRLEDYKDDLMDATISGVDTLFTAQYATNSGFGTSIGFIETQVSKINTLLGITAGATGLNSVFNLGTFTSDLINFLNSSGADGFTSNTSNYIKETSNLLASNTYTTSNNLIEYTNITSNNLIEYTNNTSNNLITYTNTTSNNLIGYTNTTSNNLIAYTNTTSNLLATNINNTSNNLIAYTNTTSNNLIAYTNTTSNNLIGNINNTSNWIKYLKTETDALWLKSGSNVYNLGSNIGIGTSTPEYKLDVYGTTQTEGLIVNPVLNQQDIINKQNAFDYIRNIRYSNRFWIVEKGHLINYGFEYYGTSFVNPPMTYYNEELNKYVCIYKNNGNIDGILGYLSPSVFDEFYTFLVGVNIKLDTTILNGATHGAPQRIIGIWKGGAFDFSIMYYVSLQPVDYNNKTVIQCHCDGVSETSVNLDINPKIEHYWIVYVDSGYMFVYCDGVLVFSPIITASGSKPLTQIYIGSPEPVSYNSSMIYSDVVIEIGYSAYFVYVDRVGYDLYNPIKDIYKNTENNTKLYGNTYIENLNINSMYQNNYKVYLKYGNSK